MRRTILPLLVMLMLAFSLSALGCARKAQHEPRPLAQGLRVGIASFSQPHSTGDLIMGRLPDAQGIVSNDVLVQLNSSFAALLTKTATRPVMMLPPLHDAKKEQVHAAENAAALPRWVAYGKQHRLDLLVVPMVLDWHQRQGSAAGVTDSAAVHVEFYLIDVHSGGLQNRSITKEKQVGLSDNLLTMPQFFKRHASWVTAEELTQEAMAKAIKDLGL
jgi:hypothetical protein